MIDPVYEQRKALLGRVRRALRARCADRIDIDTYERLVSRHTEAERVTSRGKIYRRYDL